ncbi:sigma factor-like helix-turn-helix DNA-binding protein [Streptomyces sp. NPDC004327]|uniref:sigma factor-like helix-turn-helix DNA-binding protein n=1 Tax=unclassified Streptomyces TaxID=2593676 RepID=UPI0036C9946A
MNAPDAGPAAPADLRAAMASRLLGPSGEAAEALRVGATPQDVARTCLDLLRSREARRPVLKDPWDRSLPRRGERDALDVLTPSERVVFVLHDEFSIPYDDIAPVLDRSPAATRRLAGRARHRLEGTEEMPAPDPARQREAVLAFRSAARGGDPAALRALLDPDAVLRSDTSATPPAHGAPAVARALAERVRATLPALVDGAAGLLRTAPDGRPETVFRFTVLDDRITAVDALSDGEHLARLTLTRMAQERGQGLSGGPGSDRP